MRERPRPEIPDFEAAHSREEEKEIHSMSLDPHVREAERIAAEHTEALKRREAGVGLEIDELLDEYSAAVRALEAKPDDEELQKRRDVVRARLETAGMFHSRLESALPTVLAEAQRKGDERFERAERARETRVKAREERVEERLVRERAKAFLEFLEVFDQAMRQVEANIRLLPMTNRGQFRSSMNGIRQRKEKHINERVYEGIDFESVLLNPTDLDIDSWNDLVDRMRQFSTEMIELNHEIRGQLRGRQES